MFSAAWLVPVFTRTFPFDLVVRIWDVFVAEPNWKVCYRVALALLKTFESELLASDLEGIMTLLRPDNLARRLEERALCDTVWEAAYAINLKSASIQSLHIKFTNAEARVAS